MRFPPQLLDEIRARLPVSQVVARKVALKKKGREFAGLSPFKVEKTPSFFVNDQKGFYHCFASGEHGDIFDFVIKTEGLSFWEAVERLAGEAGVQLPKPEARDLGPEARLRHEAREDERQRLYALLAASAKYFEDALSGAQGREARAYLDRRGLKRATIGEFRIGYAPNSRSALKEHLANVGFTTEEMISSGMLIGGEDIPVAYDRFRNRVMFPIDDLKGRPIAFGGRALDADAPAKYLNSPETPLFHKGHVLFNLHRARPAAHDKGRIVAVEGYMDVVSIAEAGLAEAVAPLGTALTEDQLKLLWRMAPEPILCFDGDSAGRKAAFRAIDTALPHLKPGASLSFAFLPDGLDPDDLVRQQGRDALEGVLGRSKPLVEVLFEREWSSGDWTTPERRARLESQLRALTARIGDGTVRGHYERDLRQRLWQAWSGKARSGQSSGQSTGQRRMEPASSPYWPPRPGYNAQRTGSRPPGDPRARQAFAAGHRGGNMLGGHSFPSSSLKNSRLVAHEAAAPYREALLLMAVINHPWLIDDHSEDLAALELTSTALSRLRNAILSAQAGDNSLDSPSLRSHLSELGLDKVVDLVERSVTHKCDKFAEPQSERAEVEVGWRHALALHDRQVGLKRSLEAAEKAWHEDRSEEAFARICEIQSLLGQFTGVDEPGAAA